MHLDIKSKNIEITDAIRQAIEEKMSKLDEELESFGASVTVEVEVAKTTEHHHKGEIFRAEVHVRLPGDLVYAESDGEDLYMAIREARDRALRQVVDRKESRTDKRKQEEE